MSLHYKNDEICQVGQPLLDMEVGDDVNVKEVAKTEEPAQKPQAVAEKPTEKPAEQPIAKQAASKEVG